MDIQEKVMKFKVPILFGTILTTFILFLVYLAPSFLEVIKYFWPLLVSTALFLVTIVVFGRISPPHMEASAEKAGEGILDYVAPPENIEPPPPVDDEKETETETEAEAEASTSTSATGKAKAAQNNDEY
ncbi:hypothetical protein ACH5RR_027776 [Cinchona calisaya]|uniref:Uncharacterized protein n=1 Tax=Cinchona calisaya TaxID=153742 RepID=A0ABD2YQX0_9GENT